MRTRFRPPAGRSHPPPRRLLGLLTFLLAGMAIVACATATIAAAQTIAPRPPGETDPPGVNPPSGVVAADTRSDRGESITVEWGIRHACMADLNAMEFRLNGDTYGTWSSAYGPHCSCGNPAVGLASFSVDPALYYHNNENTLEIIHNPTGSCHEAITTVPSYAAGTMIVLTTDYGCP